MQKGNDLKKSSGKARTWQQVYMILFDCEENDVPSQYCKLAPIRECGEC